MQTKTNKATERQPIRNGGFQSGIRQVVPYPGKQASKQYFRRIAAVASAIAATPAKQQPQGRPIDYRLNLIQNAASRRLNQPIRKAHLTDIALKHGSPQ